MQGNKITGKNATVLLGASATAMYAVCDIAAKIEVDRKKNVEEIITYCEVEPVDGAGTASMKGTLYAKKGAIGVLVSIAVTAGGSGYTSAPTVSFTGGGGTGAAATAVIDPQTGKVIAVIVTNNGSGYTSAPAVSFTGGGGTGAAATAKIAGYNADWLEPLFEGSNSVGGRIYYEIRPDGDGTGKPTYTGYFLPGGWKMAMPEDKGAWSFEFDGTCNGWPARALQP
jgi:hypothetical protein